MRRLNVLSFFALPFSVRGLQELLNRILSEYSIFVKSFITAVELLLKNQKTSAGILSDRGLPYGANDFDNYLASMPVTLKSRASTVFFKTSSVTVSSQVTRA